MRSKALVFALLAVACVAAAAGGAYLATRQNAASALQPATAQAGPSAKPATAVPDRNLAASPADVSTSPAPPTPSTATPSTARRSPAASGRQASSAPQAAPEPALRGSDEGRRDAGAAAPPRPWPTGSGTVTPVQVPQPPAPPTPPVAETAPSQDVKEPAPPPREYEQLVVPAEAVLGLQLETSIDSERAQIEDRVDAKVTRDVRVGTRVAIPAGTRVTGSVVQVGRGGKVKERASLAVRFHTVHLADGTELSINTDAIYRESESPVSKSAAKIGGAAIGGAIIGGIIGGGKGAAIGSSIGAAGGTTAVMAGDRATVVLPAGTLFTVRMLAPVTVAIEK